MTRLRMAAGATALTFVGLALLLSTQHVSVHEKQAIANLANVVAAGAVLALSWRATRRAGSDLRRGWTCLTAAAGCWFSGNLIWTYYQLLAERQPFPSLADACYLAAVPCAAAALLGFQVLPAKGAGRARVVLNGFLTSVSLLFVAWQLLLAPLWHQASGGKLNQLVVVAYPAADVVLATLALGMLIRSRLPRRTSVLVVLGLALYFVGDAHLALSTLRQDFGIGKVLDLGWTAGYASLAWAAALNGSRRPGRVTPRARVLEVSAPYLTVLAAVVVAAVADVTQDSVLLALGVVGLLLVGVHQGLVLGENVALTADLEDAVEVRTAQLEASRRELSHLAFHDPLTGLINRARLRATLEAALAAPSGQPESCAVLLLDVDDFKTTNDTLGHSYGDALLVALAGRLRQAVAEGDVVARLGGDEFAIVLEHLDGPQAAVALAEQILAATHVPMDVDGHAIRASVSIGIVVGGLGDDPDDLLRHADVAMYQAKAGGKGRHTMFVPEMHAEVVDRLQLKADIRRAIDDDEFLPFFQPIVDMQSEQVVGMEALARWQHPVRGLISPAVFIPLAEETGLINEIGRLVLHRACAVVQQCRALTNRPIGVSVNVSARQLREGAFVGDVRDVLAATGIPAGAVTLEVTESMLLLEADTSIATLHGLRALGVHLALDDFGTGYSSLSQLKHLPVDHLKIDKSFIDGLREPDSRHHVWSRAVISLAQQLGLMVTAEGVEHRVQAEALRLLRCDRAQGFLFARPVPAEELLAALQAPVAMPSML